MPLLFAWQAGRAPVESDGVGRAAHRLWVVLVQRGQHPLRPTRLELRVLRLVLSVGVRRRVSGGGLIAEGLVALKMRPLGRREDLAAVEVGMPCLERARVAARDDRRAAGRMVESGAAHAPRARGPCTRER